MNGSTTLGATGTAARSAPDGFVNLAGALRPDEDPDGLLTLTLTNPTVFVGIGGSVNTTLFTVTDGTVGSPRLRVVGRGRARHGQPLRRRGARAWPRRAWSASRAVRLAVGSLEAVVDPSGTDFSAVDPTLTGAVTLQASGNAAASADGFVNLAGGFDLTKTPTLLTLTLTNPTVFVGIGGSVNTTLFTVTDGTVGFHGSASSVVVGLDTANHYGVAVHGLAASVVGVSAVQLAVGSLEAIVDPSGTDFSAVDPSLTGAVTLQASGNAAAFRGRVRQPGGRLRPMTEEPRRC